MGSSMRTDAAAPSASNTGALCDRAAVASESRVSPVIVVHPAGRCAPRSIRLTESPEHPCSLRVRAHTTGA
jgi:hypothetical protein